MVMIMSLRQSLRSEIASEKQNVKALFILPKRSIILKKLHVNKNLEQQDDLCEGI